MSVRVIGLNDVLKDLKQQSDKHNRAVDDAVVVVANTIRRDAVISINKQTRGSDTVKKGNKRHYVSPEGVAPNTDTGALVRSISVAHIRGTQEAEVFSDLDYAAYLEFVLNRPWLSPASAGKDQLLSQTITNHVIKALK